MIEFYFEIWKSKRYSVSADFSTPEYDTMEVIEAPDAKTALALIKARIDTANNAIVGANHRYTARALREV